MPLLLTAQETASDAERGMKEWQVARHYGPADSLNVAVNEGTWMNMDVSPDGREIVFDLLGDIYIMPIQGGQAHLLADGSQQGQCLLS